MKSYINKNSLLLSLLTVLLIGGCSDDGATTVINQDQSPPVVLSTLPINGTTTIALNTAFTITFNEAINADSVDDTSVLLSGPNGEVEGNVTTTTNIIVFTPQDSLAPGSIYTLTLTNNITDLSNNALITDINWSFTTRSIPDNTSPSILTVTPADGGNEVNQHTIITINFDEPMNVSTLNSTTLRLLHNETALSGSIESIGNSVIFTPTSPLGNGTLYSVLITSGAHDLAGNPLPADYSWSFTTQGTLDITPPTVTLTNPQDGKEVPYLTSQLSAYFSETMDPESFNNTAFTLENIHGPIAGNTHYNSNKMTFDIDAQRLDLRSRYTATIAKFVKDTNGLPMTEDYQWEFITLDGSWQTALKIENNNGGSMTYPQIALDGSGNAIAVFLQWGTTQKHILAKHFDVALGHWQNPIYIENEHSTDLRSPKIVVDTDGNAIAVWSQATDTRDGSIWARRFDSASGSWQTSTRMDNVNRGNAYSPVVAIDTNGNVIVLWTQYDDGTGTLWAKRFDVTSGNWDIATLIQNFTSLGTVGSYHVRMDTNGNAIAVWSQQNGGGHDIWANRFNITSGNWQSATLIESNTGSAGNPKVAIDTEGNAVVVWGQKTGTQYKVWTNSFDITSNRWLSASMIESDNMGDAEYPEITIDKSGDIIIVWIQCDDLQYNVWSSRFVKNSGYRQVPVLIGHDNGTAHTSEIAIDKDGNAIVIWDAYSKLRFRKDIWTNRLDSTTGRWQANALKMDNLYKVNSPHIVIDNNNNAIAIWQQNDDIEHPYRIWVNYFK